MSSATPTIFAKAFSNLAYIDLFGKAVQLNFNKGTKSRTKTGGFFTILFLGFWIWAVYNFGKDIYERKNPIMSTADIINAEPKPMNLSPDTFAIAFGYSEPLYGNLYKNNSIFTIKVVLQTIIHTKNSNGTITTNSIETVLDTEDCTLKHFGQSGNQFSDLPLDQLTCIKQSQSDIDPPVIEGALDSKISKSLQVLVLPCDSATSSVTCGTDDELDFYLGGRGYFAAYFTDMALNTRDYGDPITGFQNSIFTLFGNKGYKEIYFMLQHVELTTDIGWFTKDLSQESYIKYNGFTETTTAATSDILLKFQMRISTTTKQVTRSYIKIQDIFAQANGLATVALMALLFVMTPYANLKFNESIINELFEIKSANIALKNSKPVSSITRGINHKKTNQSDLESEEGENHGPPPNTNDVLLSIMKEDKEKIADFETIGSPRPLLESKSTEKYQFSDEKNDKDQQESSTNEEGVTKETPHLSLLQVPDFQETPPGKPTSPRHTPKKLSNFANMGTPSNRKRQQTYISGPNHLSLNKPQDQKPTSKNLDQEESEFQSIEIMLQGFPTEDDRNTKPFYSKKNDKELEQISEVNSSMEAANSFIAEKYYNPSYPDITPQRSHSLKKRDSKSLDNQLTSIAHTMKKKNEQDCLNITFWDYLQSFVRKSDHYKQKIKLLNAGIDMINERLDIFELFKTFRELEKLKLLLLDYEQAVLFENLPKPVLQAQADKPTDVIRSYPKQLTRTGKLVSEDRKSTEVCQAYKNLALRRSVTAIDEKLLKAYDERY